MSAKNVHFNTAATVGDNSVALAVILKEVCTPDNTLEIIDRSDDIAENVPAKGQWQKYLESGPTNSRIYTTYIDPDTGQIGYPPIIRGAGEDQILITNISAYPAASGKAPVALSHYYDLKFDHFTGSSTPESYVRIINSQGNIMKDIPFKIRRKSPTRYSILGGGFTSVGSFALGTGVLDSQAARTAAGENKWGEKWGTSADPAHLSWESSNPNFRYPPWELDEPSAHATGHDNLAEGLGGHAALTHAQIKTAAVYVSASGFWAYLSGAENTAMSGNNVQHPTGTTRGTALQLNSVNATVGELLADDYVLGGEAFAAQDASSLGIHRLCLYLPEEIVGQEGQTFWVQYNRFSSPGNVLYGYREVINPIQLNRELRDYTITYPGSPTAGKRYVPISSLDITPSGALQIPAMKDDYGYIKRRERESVFLAEPIADERDNWYLRVHDGRFDRFSIQVNVNTAQVPSSAPSGVADRNPYYHIPEFHTHQYAALNLASASGSPGGLAGYGVIQSEFVIGAEKPKLGKAVQEPVEILDPYTLRLKRRPMYFWEGDYGLSASGNVSIGNGNFVYFNNAYPLYTPPNIVDYELYGPSYLPASGVVTQPKWSHGINIYVNGSLMTNTNLLQWDFFNGILKLANPVSVDDDVIATYLYEQNYVICNNLDLNPTFNHQGGEMVGETIRIVIRPDWDTDGDGNSNYQTETLDASTHKLAYHLLRDNRTGEYSYNYASASGTVGFNLVYDPGFPSQAVGLPKGTVVLGDVTIKQHNKEDMQFLDARVRGGGIKPDSWFTKQAHLLHPLMPDDPDARKKVNPESDYYWDIGYWDGRPYQGEGVLIIQIPIQKRLDLKNRVVAQTFRESNVIPQDKTTVDNFYLLYTSYNGAYADATATLGTSTEAMSRKRAIRDYIDLQVRAFQEADQEVRKIIEKHLPLGAFYVVIDEHKRPWPMSTRSDIQHGRTIPGII